MNQTTSPAAVQQFLNDNLPAYLELLQSMVTINSFTANAAGVNQLGQLTADIFARLGFSAEFVPSHYPSFGQHLILTRPGKSGHTIGCISHLDTVYPPEEEQENDFHWQVLGDRIYGPGTADIKGGTVVIYMMLDAIRTFRPDVYEDITWLLLIDASEEDMADDFGELCRRRLAERETLAALIFEPGYMNNAGKEFWVVRSRKGMGVFNVQVEGKSAHAGSAHAVGANAITQMAEVIQRLAALTDYERQVTVNVGMVQGGTVTNRVPHYAQARLEMRAFDPDVYEGTIAQILALSKLSTVRSRENGYACRVRVELERRTLPWPVNEATNRLIAIWQESGRELGFVVKPEDRGGLSDGNHFWFAVPCLDGLGIAGGNAHSAERSPDGSKDQEYCLPGSLVPKTMLNVLGVLKLVEGAEERQG